MSKRNYIAIAIVIMLFIFSLNVGMMRMSTKRKRILIVGRGPSAYSNNIQINENVYDVVVKLKMCNCNHDLSKKCDILVFYANELNVEKVTMSHYLKCKKHNKHILIFNPFSIPISNMLNKETQDTFVETMNNNYLKKISIEHGFKFTSDPRFTTGLATILHCLHNYPNHDMDIIGFDNLVNNIDTGHFDNKSHRVTGHHSIEMEHKLLNSLRGKFNINYIT
jgi:hypothetical protein